MNVKNIIGLVKKNIWLVILLPIVCAAGMAFYSYTFIPSVYSSVVPLYIWQDETESISNDLSNYNNEQDTGSQQVTRNNIAGNISFNNMIAGDLKVYFKSNLITNAVLEELGLKSMSGYAITTDTDAKTPSRIINIIVKGENPETCANIANCYARKTQDVTAKFWNVKAINILQEAEPNYYASGPPRKMYIAVAAGVGFALALIYIAVLAYFDTSIKTKEEIEKKLKVPMLAEVPLVKKL